MRVDGSSNFAKNNRVGYFPSLAAAWRIDKEGFMKEVKAINNFKIRASAGITGNDRITSYSYLSQMGSSYYASNGSLNYGMAITNSGNPGLKWETTYQYDMGLDLDLFKSRISLTADYYLKDTRDMLYNASIPSQSGYSKQWKNLGRMTNQGFEFTLTTQNVNHKKFGWTTTVNFDTNKTRLILAGRSGALFPRVSELRFVLRAGDRPRHCRRTYRSGVRLCLGRELPALGFRLDRSQYGDCCRSLGHYLGKYEPVQIYA